MIRRRSFLGLLSLLPFGSAITSRFGQSTPPAPSVAAGTGLPEALSVVKLDGEKMYFLGRDEFWVHDGPEWKKIVKS